MNQLKTYGKLLFFITLTFSCVDKNKQVEFVFRKFVEKENPSIDKLLTDKELANWKTYYSESDSAYKDYMVAINDLYERTGSENSEETFEHYEGLFYDYIQNDRKFQFLSNIRESGMVHDAQLKQQLEFYYFLYLEGHIHAELQKINEMSGVMQKEYKALIKGCKNSTRSTDSVLDVLGVKDKYQRKWMQCYLPGKSLADKIVERAKKENEIARKMGYRNFQHYYIQSSQVDYDKLLLFYDSLELATREPYARYMLKQKSKSASRLNLNVSELRPWHGTMSGSDKYLYETLIPQKLEELGLLNVMKSYFYTIGLPIDSIIANSDFEDREGKYPNSLMFRIAKDDVRILGNENNTFWGLRESLHMFGHAVYETNVADEIPLIITQPPLALHEGIAMLFEHLANNPYWLAANLHIPADTILNYLSEDENRWMDLKLCRVNLLVFNFEKALYENPDADLNAVWRNLYAKMRMIDYPETYDCADWAFIPQIVNEGCSYYSYQVGLVFLWQLTEKIKTELPGLDPSFSNDMRIGRFLKEHLFTYGNSLPMDTLIRYASGKDLSSKAYFKMLNSMQQ